MSNGQCLGGALGFSFNPSTNKKKNMFGFFITTLAGPTSASGNTAIQSPTQFPRVFVTLCDPFPSQTLNFLHLEFPDFPQVAWQGVMGLTPEAQQIGFSVSRFSSPWIQTLRKRRSSQAGPKGCARAQADRSGVREVREAREVGQLADCLGSKSWLLLGNVIHFCLLWFSWKSPLNC